MDFNTSLNYLKKTTRIRKIKDDTSKNNNNNKQQQLRR